MGLVWVCFPGAIWAGGSWVSGPMLGYQAHREALIWAETREAVAVEIWYEVEGKPESRRALRVDRPAATPAGVQPIKFTLPLLEMGKTYRYGFLVDGKAPELPGKLRFRTTDQWEWRGPAQDFSFLTGSCAYINETAYDRPGEPYGKSPEIFRHMAKAPADFMIWLGDNVYLREADFSSISGIWYRWSHDRAIPEMQPLLAAMPHYAIWDDHDYGSNDTNRSFEFKDVTLAAFKAYYGNPSWGEPDNPGVYGKFFWGDAAFILLDNRYYRDDSNLNQDLYPEKTQYGARQLDWLKQSLLHITDLKLYPFKFICTGGQFLRDVDRADDSAMGYRREREDILQFIAEHRLHGVVFITGDVHVSSLFRKEIRPGQFVYDLTSSPLTSGSWDVTQSLWPTDPGLVPGTLTGTQNFCHVYVEGPAGARRIRIRCIDKTNTLQWEKVISATELGVPAPPAAAGS